MKLLSENGSDDASLCPSIVHVPGFNAPYVRICAMRASHLTSAACGLSAHHRSPQTSADRSRVLGLACETGAGIVNLMDQRAHSNRKLRFQGFCRSIRAIERVFWSFYSTFRSDRHYRLAFLWLYNLLSDKVLRITVYSCANAHAGPPWPLGAPPRCIRPASMQCVCS